MVGQANPNISVDCVVFGFDGHDIKVLLLQRSGRDQLDLDDDTLVLPGDLILNNEGLEAAAERVLQELTGLTKIYLEQVGAFGALDRLSKPLDQQWLRAVRLDPGARVITIGYYALINPDKYEIKPSSFAKYAEWYNLEEVEELGFDHKEILDKAVENLRNKLFKEPIGFELLPKYFSLHQLHSLYTAIFGDVLDKRNFRRKMLKTGFIQETDKLQKGVPHKPAKLYRFVKEDFEKINQDKFNFY